MRYLIFLIIASILVTSSCAGTNKRLRKNKNNKPVTENVVSAGTAAPIREVEEKLVPIENVLPDPHRYFVIIGSFRNPENARKYQDQILKEGFKPAILRTEAGLYRISVMATDDINAAREEIRRIRDRFTVYSDTWLLIQRK
ncbi:MAG: SPOR domain-containing protein [Bacteroidales bacterium]|nr:SPOR domain-containing protein [Bacteroidales bacterium]